MLVGLVSHLNDLGYVRHQLISFRVELPVVAMLLSLRSVDKTHSHENVEPYFPVVLFVTLNKVVLTFKSGSNPSVWPFK